MCGGCCENILRCFSDLAFISSIAELPLKSWIVPGMVEEKTK